MFRNPSINRFIGYIITFIGFFVTYKGAREGELNNIDGLHNIKLIIGIALVVIAFIYMMITVRCPYCHRLLEFKLWNIDTCPHCGERTDI